MTRSEPLSPVWYLAALALALVAWVGGVSVAGSAWSTVRGATVSSINRPLAARGESVAVFTDVVQAGRQIICRSREPGHASSVIPPAPLTLAIDDEGTTWHLIAFEPHGRDGVTVSCRPKDRQADNAEYASAAVDGFLQRAGLGNVIIWTGMGVAFVAATSIWFRRRRQLLTR